MIDHLFFLYTILSKGFTINIGTDYSATIDALNCTALIIPFDRHLSKISRKIKIIANKWTISTKTTKIKAY